MTVVQQQCSRWDRKRVADEIARCQLSRWRSVSHRSPRGAPQRADEPLGLSARCSPNRTPPSTGIGTSIAGARTSVCVRCACIRGTRSVGSPTTATTIANFASHPPTRRRRVREPVFTTPRGLPPHGKTVEAPYSKLDPATRPSSNPRRGTCWHSPDRRTLRSIR